MSANKTDVKFAAPRGKAQADDRARTKVGFLPFDDRILVRPDEAAGMSRGLHGTPVVLPDNAKERPQSGKVVAVGPGRLLESGGRGEMQARLGAVVLYAKYSGNTITLGPQAEEYVIMRESEAFGIEKKT